MGFENQWRIITACLWKDKHLKAFFVLFIKNKALKVEDSSNLSISSAFSYVKLFILRRIFMAGIKTIEQHQYQRKIYSVSELNRRCKMTLESQFSTIWLEAEISNLAMPASGHWYFSLKDAKSQVRCAMFKGKNRACKVPPEEGMKVLVRARVSLFEPRGEFQLIVEYLEPAGIGQLLQQYEELKAKLDQEGLFDADLKQSIHHNYQSIGVITSPTGAAVHDVISVIRRRYPLQKIVIYPALVQGNLAAEQIINQISNANRRKEVDIILLVRGGGSMEDLWCFNNEQLARAIFASSLPIVTGIGHEVDFTIADYVADLRSPTPSAAAEKTTPDQRELFEQLESLVSWQVSVIESKLDNYGQKLDWLKRQLHSPDQLINQREQQIKLLQQRMATSIQLSINQTQQRIHSSQLKLSHLDPNAAIQTAKERHLQLKKRLILAVEKNVLNNRSRFRELSIILDSLSPLATLGRGYSLTKTIDGKLLKDAASINQGDSMLTTLKNGTIESVVTKTENIDN
ncbi:MAG: exodeoxyribonuclease VII large subunit [Enterobacterales bacterium]|jgi:exodeoxyribonuclease VII large subunit